MRKIFHFTDPVRMIEGRHGHMLYNQYCHWVGKALELYGEYCEHEVQLLQALLQPTDIVWEIGANTGSMSAALARCVPEGQYIGFEPQVELYKLLMANLTLNGLENAHALNIGLGANSTIIELPSVDYNQPGNFGGISLIGATGGKHKVELKTIDELSWLPPPNLLKIDVETMEADVLRGGANTIAKQTPRIYVENDRPEKSEELIQLLWDMDYQLYWHITPYFNEDNYFNNHSNIYGPIVSMNMICIHASDNIKFEGISTITDKTAHPLLP